MLADGLSELPRSPVVPRARLALVAGTSIKARAQNTTNGDQVRSMTAWSF